MSFFSFLSSRKEPVAPAADPARLTRTQAAALCAKVLRRGQLFTLTYAPRGDAGRVAVRLVLIIAKQAQELGWIEVPLSGAITLTLDDSSVAAQIGAEVAQVIEGAFRGVVVVPVAADPRQAARNGYVVRQAATGIWTVATRDGEVHAAGDTFEDAIAIASKAPVGAIALGQGEGGHGAAGRGAAGRGAGGQDAGAVQVTMEPAYAARWIAHALREGGHSAWVDGATIDLGSGRAGRVAIGSDGAHFASDCPEPQRTLISAALGAVRIVDHLE